jgi:serine/threonine protein kinase
MGFAAGTSRGYRRGRPDERARTRIGRPMTIEPPRGAATSEVTARADASRLPGAPVGGAYQLGTPLGAGDGDVYETTHSRMPGRFAMKLLRRGQGAPVEAIERFRADVERTASLRHPNIAEVLEIGAMGAEGEEIPLVVMERLEGQTLAERMARRDRMALSEVVPLVREVANALEAAHQVGVTHGAVRPDNVFLAEIAGYERGFVKLLDFGVAHLDASMQGRGTSTDLGADFIRYLSPEQARAVAEGDTSPAMDPRSDQFGLAAVTYRLLSGQDPFAGGDARLVLEAVKAAALRPLDELSGCDLRVSGVIHRALARDPARRYESVLAFAKAFEDAASSELSGARPTPVEMNSQRAANEPLPAEVTPRVAVHPSLRAKSEPSHVRPAEELPPPRSFVRPNSVTQVFFAEGERKEQGEWTAADLEEFQDDDPEVRFDSFDELPRRRTRFVLPLVGLGLVALAAFAAWTGWRPSFLHFNPSMRPGPVAANPTELEATPAPGIEPVPVPAAPAAVPATTGPTTGAAAAPVAGEVARGGTPRTEKRAPVTATVPAARQREPVAVPSAPVEVPPAPAAVPTEILAPAPTQLAAPTQAPIEVPAPSAGGVPAQQAAPALAQPAAPVAQPAAPVADPALAPANPAAAPAAVAPEPGAVPPAPAAQPARGSGERPLRGYVWSPREGRLVPVE